MAVFKCLIILMAVECCLIFAEDDPKSGMDCKTAEQFEYCEGKSPAYSNAAKDAQSGSDNTQLLTRGHGGAAGGPQYGFIPPKQCDSDDQDHCRQLNILIAPTLLKNNKGQSRYILQTSSIIQKVQLAICSDNKCGRSSSCDQQYASVQLLAWEPSPRRPKLVVDTFRVPSCCRCSRTSFPGSHH